LVSRYLWFNITFWLQTRRHGVRTRFISGSLVHSDISRAIYVDYLPEALARRCFRPMPMPLVAGSGLEDIQAALDLQREGVSARKIVVCRGQYPGADSPIGSNRTQHLIGVGIAYPFGGSREVTARSRLRSWQPH
jgi:hypothetical protein